ncbi:MAG: hypothetical protein WCC64_19745 [Aliidongia sp.]
MRDAASPFGLFWGNVMVRSSIGIKRHRLGRALVAAIGLWAVAVGPVPAQDRPNQPASAGQLLDELAGKDRPAAPTVVQRDTSDAASGVPSRESDQLSRLGLAPLDPAHLPRLRDGRGNAPPADDDPAGVGATIFATVVFILAFFLLSRVFR